MQFPLLNLENNWHDPSNLGATDSFILDYSLKNVSKLFPMSFSIYVSGYASKTCLLASLGLSLFFYLVGYSLVCFMYQVADNPGTFML